MVFDVPAGLLGMIEPGYELDRLVELPDGTEPELMYDGVAETTGGTAYPVEVLMVLELDEEVG